MIAKCDCIHCQNPIEFGSEHSGETIDCPHCGKRTRLAIPIQQAAAPPFKQVTPLPPLAVVTGGIEDGLDNIGSVFFLLGVICAVVSTIALIAVSFTNGEFADPYPTGTGVSLIVIIVASLAQGWIVKTLFGVLAEIIRLLRGILLASQPKA